jgi:hypothetical protein
MADKIAPITGIHEVDPSTPIEQDRNRRPDKDVRSALWAIVTGVALPCLPILVILAVLIAVIFEHRIKPWEGFAELALNSTGTAAKDHLTATIFDIRHNGGSNAYLVRYNPSTLTTIASWTSRIIPYLTSSIMALVAFFAARHIVQQSKRGEDAVLPDPEQLTILISLLGGSGLSPLKDTLIYRWLKKERLVSPVPAVAWILAFITFLGLLIPLVDTWFGIATHATAITILSNTTKKQEYGRQLARTGDNAFCPDGPGYNISYVWITDTFWPCSVTAGSLGAGAPNHVALADPVNATKLQYGVQTANSVSNSTVNSTNWFFFTDPRANSELDFVGSSPAISTECTSMTAKCRANASSTGGFVCSEGFRGNVYRKWPNVLGNETDPDDLQSISDITGIAFAGDAALNEIPGLVNTTLPDGSGHGPQWPEILPRNPTHFGTWAVNYPSYDNTPAGLVGDDFIMAEGGTMWFLNCSSTVANVTYAWSNGSLIHFDPVIASPEMAALLLGQYSVSGVTPDFKTSVDFTLATIANLASVSDSMTQLSTVWATQFSKNTLARSIGAFAPLTNVIEQHREAGVIVARVPLAPLYLLIGVKLIYVIAVIALAIGAYAFTHPAETEVVKAQLSAKGLAAAHFDQPALVQANAVKAVQERLDMVGQKRANTDPSTTGWASGTEPQPGQLRRAETSPAEIEGGKPKVGLVPGVDGTWKFVVMANGVWHSISPIVKSFVENEAKKGDMGVVGDVINAWK